MLFGVCNGNDFTASCPDVQAALAGQVDVDCGADASSWVWTGDRLNFRHLLQAADGEPTATYGAGGRPDPGSRLSIHREA